MANTTATWYRGSGSNPWTGQIGYDGSAMVGRFSFTTPATGASSVSWRTDTLSPREQTTWNQSDRAGYFRWAITNNASSYIGTASSSAGTAVGVNIDGSSNNINSGGASSVQLMPNTTYYLWIFPSGSTYNHWYVSGVTITLSGSYGNPGTPSASNGTFGSAVAISITGGTSIATYTVTTSCGGYSQTLQTKSANTSLSWTPAVATYAPRITNASSASATITVTTYYGNASVGTKSVTITLSFRAADVKPSATMALSDPTGYASTYGAYVATKSKITAQLTATTQYSATASAYQITANGTTFNTNPATTAEIASTSYTSVTGKVTDSRGFSSDMVTQSISILAYTPPQINGFVIHRCLQDGTLDDSGAYMRVDYDVAITALNNINSKALMLKYKKRSDASYTSETVTLTAYTQSGHVIVANIDTNYTYDVQLVLTDDFSTVTITLQLSTAYATLNFRAGGKGVAIGKVSEREKAVEIASDWELYIGDDRVMPGALHLTALITTLPCTITDSGIAEDMRVAACSFGTPGAILSNITWTTGAGSIVLSGSVNGSTTLDLILIKCNERRNS